MKNIKKILNNKIVKNVVAPLTIAAIISTAITSYIGFIVDVPTNSMFPTINKNENFLVAKIHDENKIKRKDVLAFYSKEFNKLLVKRVIGLPGDIIEIKDDFSVYINGELLHEDYVAVPGGKTGVFEVPENKYFFLGDNRTESIDSRYFKEPYIEFKDIKGKLNIKH